MNFLIALPFAGLIAAILTIRILRRFRELDEARRQRMEDSFNAPRRKPSDDLHDQVWFPLCDRLAQVAAERIGRPLTSQQRKRIWRSRTTTVLEIAMKEVEAARSPEEVAALLTTLPQGVNRPDPTGWCNRTG